MFAFLDTPFDREYPVYTRANAGEILPHPLTPLAWSVIGTHFEEGFRISFCDDFGLMPRPGLETPFQMTGKLAARLHLNLSVLRTTADRLPGTSADVVDVQYFGDAAATGLPDHRPSGDDRRFRLKSPPSMGRTLAGIGRRVDRDRAGVDELQREVDDLLRTAGTTDADLVWAVRRCGGMFGRALGTHVTARALTSPMLEQATNALVRGGVAPEDSLRHLAGIPDLESAKPSRALAAIARSIVPGSELAAVVARRSFDELGRSDAPGAPALHVALTEFLQSYGHRGIGEFDPTWPAWEQRPDDVVALLASIGHDREDVAPRLDVDPGRLARPLVAAARSAMARAERTKDTTMRITNQMRRLLFALRDRWADQLPSELFAMCTLDELEAVAHGSGLPARGELERRAEQFAAASAISVAEWSDGSLRTVDAAIGSGTGDEACDGALEVAGLGGSPGVAVGRARVTDDPYGDFEAGDILVATMTDTAWTPLFLAAGAVVTDVGGVLSHATIVARDLGIPAVVNAKRATTAIRTGDTVRVDGGTGVVTVLERA